jgi:leader peptidase (prepilin peptidase) / N-methyltransferase
LDTVGTISVLFAALLGAVIGSFLNVVIYRLPLRESLVWPGSHCPSCGHDIRWYHNIPLVGWLLLRGRCRDCGERISLRYPLVELLTAGLFASALLVEGLQPRLLLIWFFLAVLVAVTFIDLDHLIIPDRLVLPGAVIGFLGATLLAPERWWEFLLAAFGAAAFLFVLGIIWPGGMGFGDVKLALMMGAVLGHAVTVALFLGFLLGGLVGGLLLVTRVKSRKDKIPFGPYLALGSAIAVLAGQQLLDAYLSLYA